MKKALIALPIALALLLPSCGGESQPTSSVGPSEETSSTSPDSSSEVSESEEESQSSSAEEVVFPSYSEIQEDIVMGGYLTEVGIGIAFIAGRDYTISFYFSVADMDGVEVFSTHPEYLEVEPTDTAGTYILHCKKVGDPGLFIRDAEGRTHYRNNVHIREAIPLEEMEDYLVGIDHYQSWGINGGNIQFTFLGNSTAMLTGTDEGNVPLGKNGIKFTYEYDMTIEDAGMYVFKILDWENPYTGLTANAFHVSMAGDIIHLTNGTIGTTSFYTCEIFQVAEAAAQ